MHLIAVLILIEDVLYGQPHKETAAVFTHWTILRLLSLALLGREFVLQEDGLLEERLPDAVLDDLGHADDSLNHLAETLNGYLAACEKKSQRP